MIGKIATRAIRIECESMKLGNVHPQASFADMSIESFRSAADSIGLAVSEHFDGLDRHSLSRQSIPAGSIGKLCLSAVEAMLAAVGVNTSLGTILLFSPVLHAYQCRLALASPSGTPMDLSPRDIQQTLAQLTSEDTCLVYEAIRRCQPGGIGKSSEMDIGSSAPLSLMDAMRHASTNDDVAFEYVNHFAISFELANRYRELRNVETDTNAPKPLSCIQLLQLELLANRPDSLIRRKGGDQIALEVQSRARNLLQSYRHLEAAFQVSDNLGGQCQLFQQDWDSLDRWMRSHQNQAGKQRCNPGTHADLIATAILLHELRCTTPS